MTDTTAVTPRAETDRNLAMLGYGLLFIAVCFAGVTALVAVIIAYVMRDGAGPATRDHFRFQIRIFWIALALTVASMGAGLAAAMLAFGDLVRHGLLAEWDAWDFVGDIDIDLSDLRIDPAVILLAVVSAVAGLLAGLWLICAPAVGFIRLATARAIGQTPAS